MVAVVLIAYYLSGFAPVSPDDMEMFEDTVNEGIQNGTKL